MVLDPVAWVDPMATRLSAGVYDDEGKRAQPRLSVFGYDETDIHPRPGPDGAQDKLDRSLQADQRRLADRRAELAAASRALPKCGGEIGVDRPAFVASLEALVAADADLRQALYAVAAAQKRVPAKIKQLQAALRKKSGARAEKVQAHIDLLLDRVRRAADLADRHSQWAAQVGVLHALATPAGAIAAAAAAPSGAAAMLPPSRASVHAVVTRLAIAEEMLLLAFELSHIPASKVLAVVMMAALEAPRWGLSGYAFTHDTTPKWEHREIVTRVMEAAFQRSSGAVLPLARAADKATINFSHADPDGRAKSLTAFRKEAALLLRLVSHGSKQIAVPVAKVSRRALLEQAVATLLQLRPDIARPAWMADRHKRVSVPRWRELLSEHDQTSIQLPGIDVKSLQQAGLLGETATVRLDAIAAAGKERLVRQLYRPAQLSQHIHRGKISDADCRSLLIKKAAAFEAKLSEIKLADLRKVPAVVAAVTEMLRRSYELIGRRFGPGEAFCYPEVIELRDSRLAPRRMLLFDFWDADHALKNFRSACISALRKFKAAAAAGCAATSGPAGEADEFADVEALDAEHDQDDDDDDAAAPVVGSPALIIAQACEALLQQPQPPTWLDPRVLEVGYLAQHVGTARGLFCWETAVEMRASGRVPAAEWVEAITLYHASFETRGFTRDVRRQMVCEVRSPLPPSCARAKGGDLTSCPVCTAARAQAAGAGRRRAAAAALSRRLLARPGRRRPLQHLREAPDRGAARASGRRALLRPPRRFQPVRAAKRANRRRASARPQRSTQAAAPCSDERSCVFALPTQRRDDLRGAQDAVRSEPDQEASGARLAGDAATAPAAASAAGRARLGGTLRHAPHVRLQAARGALVRLQVHGAVHAGGHRPRLRCVCGVDTPLRG